MVLHVLHMIHSTELEKYLDLADESEYYYLKDNAREIRKGQNGVCGYEIDNSLGNLYNNRL